MPVLKRRSRIVSFRLSDEEYAAMMECCISRGSRSLSDYARSAACHHAVGASGLGGDGSNVQSIEELKNRVEELDRMVQRLTRVLDSPRPAETGLSKAEAGSIRKTARKG